MQISTLISKLSLFPSGSITSAELATLLSDETGSGAAVFAFSPTITSPTLLGDTVIGGGASASQVQFLEPSGGGTSYTAFQAQAQSASVTYTLPAADGTAAGYVLRTDAAGTLSWVPAREVLTADRTYYVRTDGSDSNTGLANTSGEAFLTLNKAIDVIAALDCSIYNPTISVADGTYTTPVVLKNFVGSGTATITGSSSAIISTTSNQAVLVSGIYSKWNFDGGIKTQTTTSGSCFYLENNSFLLLGSVTFGASAAGHVLSADGSTVRLNSSYSITGGAAYHLYASDVGRIIHAGSITITLTGTPAFSTAFCNCPSAGVIRANSLTYSGSATGKRFIINGNSVVRNGGSATYFPGDVAGTTATGGQNI